MEVDKPRGYDKSGGIDDRGAGFSGQFADLGNSTVPYGNVSQASG
jgi:hypothetical protein